MPNDSKSLKQRVSSSSLKSAHSTATKDHHHQPHLRGGVRNTSQANSNDANSTTNPSTGTSSSPLNPQSASSQFQTSFNNRTSSKKQSNVSSNSNTPSSTFSILNAIPKNHVLPPAPFIDSFAILILFLHLPTVFRIIIHCIFITLLSPAFPFTLKDIWKFLISLPPLSFFFSSTPSSTSTASLHTGGMVPKSEQSASSKSSLHLDPEESSSDHVKSSPSATFSPSAFIKAIVFDFLCAITTIYLTPILRNVVLVFATSIVASSVGGGSRTILNAIYATLVVEVLGFFWDQLSIYYLRRIILSPQDSSTSHHHIPTIPNPPPQFTTTNNDKFSHNTQQQHSSFISSSQPPSADSAAAGSKQSLWNTIVEKSAEAVAATANRKHKHNPLPNSDIPPNNIPIWEKVASTQISSGTSSTGTSTTNIDPLVGALDDLATGAAGIVGGGAGGIGNILNQQPYHQQNLPPSSFNTLTSVLKIIPNFIKFLKNYDWYHELPQLIVQMIAIYVIYLGLKLYFKGGDFSLASATDFSAFTSSNSNTNNHESESSSKTSTNNNSNNSNTNNNNNNSSEFSGVVPFPTTDSSNMDEVYFRDVIEIPVPFPVSYRQDLNKIQSTLDTDKSSSDFDSPQPNSNDPLTNTTRNQKSLNTNGPTTNSSAIGKRISAYNKRASLVKANQPLWSILASSIVMAARHEHMPNAFPFTKDNIPYDAVAASFYTESGVPTVLPQKQSDSKEGTTTTTAAALPAPTPNSNPPITTSSDNDSNTIKFSNKIQDPSSRSSSNTSGSTLASYKSFAEGTGYGTFVTYIFEKVVGLIVTNVLKPVPELYSVRVNKVQWKQVVIKPALVLDDCMTVVSNPNKQQPQQQQQQQPSNESNGDASEESTISSDHDEEPDSTNNKAQQPPNSIFIVIHGLTSATVYDIEVWYTPKSSKSGPKEYIIGKCSVCTTVPPDDYYLYAAAVGNTSSSTFYNINNGGRASGLSGSSQQGLSNLGLNLTSSANLKALASNNSSSVSAGDSNTTIYSPVPIYGAVNSALANGTTNTNSTSVAGSAALQTIAPPARPLSPVTTLLDTLTQTQMTVSDVKSALKKYRKEHQKIVAALRAELDTNIAKIATSKKNDERLSKRIKELQKENEELEVADEQIREKLAEISSKQEAEDEKYKAAKIEHDEMLKKTTFIRQREKNAEEALQKRVDELKTDIKSLTAKRDKFLGRKKAAEESLKKNNEDEIKDLVEEFIKKREEIKEQKKQRRLDSSTEFKNAIDLMDNGRKEIDQKTENLLKTIAQIQQQQQHSLMASKSNLSLRTSYSIAPSLVSVSTAPPSVNMPSMQSVQPTNESPNNIHPSLTNNSNNNNNNPTGTPTNTSPNQLNSSLMPFNANATSTPSPPVPFTSMAYASQFHQSQQSPASSSPSSMAFTGSSPTSISSGLVASGTSSVFVNNNGNNSPQGNNTSSNNSFAFGSSLTSAPTNPSSNPATTTTTLGNMFGSSNNNNSGNLMNNVYNLTSTNTNATTSNAINGAPGGGSMSSSFFPDTSLINNLAPPSSISSTQLGSTSSLNTDSGDVTTTVNQSNNSFAKEEEQILSNKTSASNFNSTFVDELNEEESDLPVQTSSPLMAPKDEKDSTNKSVLSEEEKQQETQQSTSEQITTTLSSSSSTKNQSEDVPLTTTLSSSSKKKNNNNNKNKKNNKKK